MQITPSFLKTKLKAVWRRLHQHSFLSPFRPKKLKRKKTSPNPPPIPYSKFTPSSLIYDLKSQKSPHVLIAALAIILILAPAVYFLTKNPKQTEAAWFNGEWRYRKILYIDNSAQSEDLANFPIMVKITSSNFNFNQAQSDGKDIRFTDSNGKTTLSYEIESWDKSSSEATIWVKVPQINSASSSDYIFIYWGNPTATDDQDTDNTWASNYKGVYHLNDNTSNTTVTDSSGNNNNITASDNTSTYSSSGQLASAFTTMGTPQHLPNPTGGLIAELYPSIQLDSNDNPVVAYHNNSNNDLVIVHCNDKDCKGDDESAETVISEGNTGDYPSLQLDSSDYPMITFFDEDSDDLYYTHCNDTNCSGGDEAAVVLDSGGDVGRFSSLTLDSSGNPVVAYRDNTNDDLKLIHCDDADCSSYSTNTVDTSANIVYFHSLSLQLDSSGYPTIAYYDSTNRQVKITHCNDADCSGGNETTTAVVDGGNEYRHLSMQLDSSDYPMISYLDETIDDIFYIHCDDTNCAGTETPVTIDTGRWAYPWMQLNNSGVPLIITSSGYPRLFVCSDADCTTESANYVTLYNQYGSYYPEMVLDSNDYPVIVSYNRGQTNDYDVDIYRLSPKLKQNYDADFNFDNNDFTISTWFKSEENRAAKENYLVSRYDNDQGFKVFLDYAGHACFGIDDDSSFGPDDQACSSSSQTETNIDNSLAVSPRYNSMKLDSSGYPVISYFDDSGDDLELIHCNDANCSGGDETTTQIDTTDDVGRYNSLILDSSGYPVISYYDNTADDLKIVHCGDANCSSGNTINTLDTTGNVGYYTSIALDSSGNPYIGYYDVTNTAVKLIHCNDANCSGGDESTVTVDNTEYDMPFYSSTWLKLNSSGYPVMTYQNYTAYDLKLARCTDANCTSPVITTVETSGTVGNWASLELDNSNYPVIATHRSGQDLKLIRCSNIDCTSITSNFVKDSTTDGESGYYYIDLELNSSNEYPVILHTSLAEWAQVLTVCNDLYCADNNEAFSYIQGDPYNHVYSSLELDSNNYPIIAYSTSSMVNLVHLTNTTTYTDSGSYNDGQWHQLVAVKDDTNSIKTYVDGQLVASDTSIGASGTLTSDSAELRLAETITQIGGNDYSTYNWSGSIDEVQIDSTARSADWIAAQYLSETNAFITYGTTQTSPRGENPAAYWKFDEGYGTTAHDSTQNANDGTISGATWQDESMCVSGKCLKFNGTGSSIGITSTTLDLDNEHTVSMWVKVNNWTSYWNSAGLMQGPNNRNWDDSITLRESSGTQISIQDDAGTVKTLNFNKSITLNQWYHIVISFNSQDIDLYVNGIYQDNDTSYAADSNLTIDRLGEGYGDDEELDGFLDEVKIYSYAHSADQIKADYQQGMSALLGHKDQVFMSNGLVGYWKMDETTSPSLDYSGRGYSATWNGDASSTSGKYGGGINQADGGGGYISVSDTGNPFDLGTSNFSVSMWFKLDSLANPDAPELLDKMVGASEGYHLRVGYSDEIEFQIEGTNSNIEVNSANSAISTDTWYYVVAVYDKNNGSKIYINGQQSGSTVQGDAGNIDNSDALKIGVGFNSWEMDGAYDEVRIYNLALSPKEVRDLYNWAPGPVGYWKMDEGIGTSAYDTSGNGNTGTLTNSPSWTQGKFGKAIKLTTANKYIDVPTLTPNITNKSLTIEGWVNLNTGGVQRIFTERSLGYPQIGITGTTLFVHTTTSSGTDINLPSTSLPSNCQSGWHYLSVTWDTSASSNNVKAYCDGVNFTNGTLVNSINGTFNSTGLKIGHNTGDQSVNGSIDEVKIYNYARTPGQIIEDMNAGHSIGGSPISSKLLHLNLDQAYGTVAQDSGFNQDNGELLDGAAWTTSGKYNHGIDLDGLNDRIQTFTSNPFEYIGEDLTLSLWLNPDSGEGAGRIISKPWNGSGQYNYVLLLNSNDTLNFYLLGTSGWSTTTTATIPEGSWSHVAVTVKEGTNAVKIYKNGNLIKSDTHNITGWTPSSGDDNVSLCIGSLYPYGPSWAGNVDFSFDGKMDEIKIYNTTLTEDQIKLDMNQGASNVFGSLSTASDGSTPDNSASRKYCVPGDTSTCNPPVAEWKLDEKTGTSAYDTSDNGNTGTLTNSPTWKSAAECKQGACLDFNGSDESISLSSLPSISAPYTIETWIYPQELDRGQTFLSLKGSNSYPVFNLNSNNKLLAYAGSEKYRYGSKVFDSNDLNKWWHIAFVVQNSGSLTDWKVYVNGTDDTGVSGGNTGDYYDPSTSGAISSGSGYFNGKIDDVRIYNYARTPAQIAWDYNRGQPVGYWKLDECQGLTAHDSSGNDNNGTISIGGTGTQTTLGTCSTSGAWYNGASGKQNGSLNFDGTDDYIYTADSSSLDMGTMTVSAWIKTTNSAEQYIAERNNSTFYFETSSGKVRFYLNSVGGGVWMISNQSVNDGLWHSVSATWDGTNKRIYIDGRLDKTEAGSGGNIPNSAQGINIGVRKNAGVPTGYFNGQLDDVRIYNYALTDQQIKILHNFGSTIYFSL